MKEDYKIINGVCIRNDNYVNEINQRIFSRNIPDRPLEPNLSFYPTPTKYVKMPVVNIRRQTEQNLTQFPVYDIHKQFNPGNSRAPWNGFANNVDVESHLKNTFFALQKCDQRQFVPSSNSMMYSYSLPNLPPKNHGLLFEVPETTSHRSEFNDNEIFYNSTRCQRNQK